MTALPAGTEGDGMDRTTAGGRRRALIMATLAFALCFAVWGVVAPLAPCRTALHYGVPAEVICDLATELSADLVVVGSRGLGRLDRLLLGSVSTSVVQRAPCPVLVVR